MRILMLPRYSRLGASSRYRFMQYVPMFKQAGAEVEVWPLLDDAYIRDLYSRKRRPISSVVAGYQRRLRQMRSVRDFDAVICEQEAFPYLPDWFEGVLRRRSRRLILDYDDAAYVRYQKNPFLKNKVARLMASADCVVVGNAHLAAYAEQFARRVMQIPTVVDLSRYGKRPAPRGNTVRVAWIGTPITATFLTPLIPIFETLGQKHPKLVFRFIGAGKGMAARSFSAELPEWSEELETDLLSECDIGIMPLPDTEFTRGKCGLKLIQYMASGLPVVASPIGANREIVTHGHNGFLASSPREWQEALCRLIADPELRLRMGGAARERVEREYTLEKGFAMWMEVLRSSGVAPLARRSFVSDSQKMSGIVRAEENQPGRFLWKGPSGPTSRTGSRPRILFLITEDNYFWANRLILARKLRDLGAEVWVMTRVQNLGKELEREGFQVVPWKVSRQSLNPIREALAFLQVVRAYREVAPDLVHQIALKPIVYGGLAGRFRGETSAINMIIGLGHAFLSDSTSMRIMRQFLLALLRFSLRKENSKTIFQNRSNLEDILRAGAIKDNQCILIRGDGVNLERFSPRPEPDGIPVVILAGRLLWTKGVREFVQAAKLLRSRGISARFVLVGSTDHANPGSIPEAEVRSWVNAKLVEWWGHRDDMPNVFAQANVVCLPSYGEGAPNALMEAAACGRAVVASDVAGCRDVVRHGETGLLVRARDSADLAGALAMLIEDPDLRARMGARGRELAVREYSVDTIVNQTISVYRELLGSRIELCAAPAKDAA